MPVAYNDNIKGIKSDIVWSNIELLIVLQFFVYYFVLNDFIFTLKLYVISQYYIFSSCWLPIIWTFGLLDYFNCLN